MTNYSYLRRQEDGMHVVTVLSMPPQIYDPCYWSPKCHGLYRAMWGLVSVNKVSSINLGELLGQHAISMAVKILVIQVSQEEWTKLRKSVPYVKLYRYNPKHLYPKLNGYGDNGHRRVWASGASTYCTPSVTPYSSTAHARQRETTS